MAEIEHRHLRSALEFAVLVAAEGRRRRPPLEFPTALGPHLGGQRLPSRALGGARRAIESEPEFRSALSAVATPESVDEVGRLWLDGSEGWAERAADVLERIEEVAEERDLRRDLRRSERRRGAAERVAARVLADVIARDQRLAAARTELDEVRAELAKSLEESAELRAEVIDVRNEVRHARDREAAAIARAEGARGELDDARAELAAAHGDLDPGTGDGEAPGGRIDRDALSGAIEVADELARRLRSVVDGIGGGGAVARSAEADAEPGAESGARADDPVVRVPRDLAASRTSPSPTSAAPRRRPVALPGGTISTSAAAADHLVRSGARIVIDGYNVAMLAWPDRSLPDQRDALVARTESLARRHGADVTVVFDGSSIVGAHAGARRLIRVVYSPDGVTADDVVRAEVDATPLGEGVVVVTNDREIQRDVRRSGANVVPSNAFLAVL
ncbi:NYN domain-containing protein [Ilumatobacter sp.]|uniref:NYN domain-containing protein n=1 Tax=Ilumatobacter sp. TaxID=1967498 RepID=UPI003B523F9F